MLTGLLCNKGYITDATNSPVKRLIGSGLVGPRVQELLSPWSRVCHRPGTSVCLPRSFLNPVF